MSCNLQTDKKNIKNNTVKFADKGSCTGGYDGMYGGGYSTSHTSVQIQNSETMGEQMLKIAKEDGMELCQKEGYFNFGAGKTVKINNASVQIPTSFVCSENKENDILRFSYKKNNDEDNSPFEISLKSKELKKKQSVCEFFGERETYSVKCGMEYKELVVDGNPALLAEKIQKDSLTKTNLFILSENGSKSYDLELTFKSNLENSRSIAERVYRNFKIKKEVQKKEEINNKNLKAEKASDFSCAYIYNEKDFEQKVKKKDFSLMLPKDFEYEENTLGQRIVAFKKECTAWGYNLSPLEIWVEKINLLKEQRICDFFFSQIKTAIGLGGKYKELVVSSRPALLFMENEKSFPQTARISVLSTGGKKIYNIKIVFNKEFKNRDKIISKIYSGFEILE